MGSFNTPDHFSKAMPISLDTLKILREVRVRHWNELFDTFSIEESDADGHSLDDMVEHFTKNNQNIPHLNTRCHKSKTKSLNYTDISIYQSDCNKENYTSGTVHNAGLKRDPNSEMCEDEIENICRQTGLLKIMCIPNIHENKSESDIPKRIMTRRNASKLPTIDEYIESTSASSKYNSETNITSDRSNVELHKNKLSHITISPLKLTKPELNFASIQESHRSKSIEIVADELEIHKKHRENMCLRKNTQKILHIQNRQNESNSKYVNRRNKENSKLTTIEECFESTSVLTRGLKTSATSTTFDTTTSLVKLTKSEFDSKSNEENHRNKSSEIINCKFDMCKNQNQNGCQQKKSGSKRPKNKDKKASTMSSIGEDTINDILLYHPQMREMLPNESIYGDKFLVTEEFLSWHIGKSAAKKFFKFNIGQLMFSLNSCVYLQVPENDALFIPEDPDDDPLYLIGSCGSIYETSTDNTTQTT